ncbi:uncharacterized protein KD926_008089 [Aspergillus affinis]|uniref:uncharacterized protein n=1 Tax=Aspergillus affinis TaxID=1070780 RepID=UPI0022FEBA20|nr:uncharacterized protein KD926_008089 [Aspergillus affinis]KAI9045671.1 hypothetical protein KD926_008089 [Aspergillus affinis]
MLDAEVIIVGAGPSSIALAHTLKHKVGLNDFTIYEKMEGPGGVWRSNTYPGVGCDVPTILYSFSFNQNPNWSKELCGGSEILQYMESTVDKFDLRKHMHFSIECVSSSWNEKGFWEVRLRDLLTNIEYTRTSKAFISAVGGISKPRDVRFPGLETFHGEVFHTARWNHSYDYRGKRMAIIGNGCSAVQVVPEVAKEASFVKQYARSPQWYHERPNRSFTSLEKWFFRYIPLLERFIRLRVFLASDKVVAAYGPGVEASKLRAKAEDHAREYIFSTAPKKYHHFLVPDFPLGCKRRIFDPDYLETLHSPTVELVPHGIESVDQTGITSTDGMRTEFDVIVLATGFEVQEFLVPMQVYGRDGRSLAQQWKENRGAQAYMGTYVHGFPNFATLFGPNTFPAHNSVLFAVEVQVAYIARTLIIPLIDHRISTLEVKQTVENQWQRTELCLMAWLCINVLEGITAATLEHFSQKTQFALVDYTPYETLGCDDKPENVRISGAAFIAQDTNHHSAKYLEQCSWCCEIVCGCRFGLLVILLGIGCILHNLRMIGLGFFAGWLKSFLSNRSTRLQLPGYLSNLTLTPTGIPQGSPISPILFLLFNTPLIRALSIDGIEALRIQPTLLEGGKTVSYGWIDDVATLAISDSYAVNQRLLERALDKAALPIKDHATGFIIKPVEYAKYLGIWLDKTLSFDTHRAKALAKANRTLEALRSTSGSTWGTSLLSMRRNYLAVVVPQLLYGAAAWYSPTSRTVNYKKLQKTVNEFQRIQGLRILSDGGTEVEENRPAIREQRQAGRMGDQTGLRVSPVGVAPKDRRIWYTDGNGYQGIIGAAAVSIRADRTARKYLGTELDSTVYVGELEGARMALDRAKLIPITVFSDS